MNVVGTTCLGFQIPTLGPASCTSPGALSMKVECLRATHTHKASYAGTREFTQRLVCLLQSLLLSVLYNRRRGVGGIFCAVGQSVKLGRSAAIYFIHLFMLVNIKQILTLGLRSSSSSTIYLTNYTTGSSSTGAVTVNVNASSNAANNNVNNFTNTNTDINFLTVPLILQNGTISIGLPVTLINLINLLIG